jgi:8-oxo-dGTP pyrophosphatase MutT (NUDIX family)
VLRLAYRVGYRVLHAWWRIRRPQKRGVKCALTRGSEVLLVQHTYGPREWDLPGGGVKRGEEPSDAARREIREELGLDVPDWTFVGDLFARFGGKRDHIWCYRAEVDGAALERDRAEIAETGWFDRDRLPEPLARYVVRIASMSA